ncbi:Superoxide dismutase [Caballeronia sordidicola]|uniref:Superoxide dismutase n=1 Tax=Caballeronia sordidicola TaxID=196367 RepID=A0A226WLG2_CABSO|nr:Superoxide dismutase [Caballeronia sordidicola]
MRGYPNSPTIECSIASLLTSPIIIIEGSSHHGTYPPAVAVRQERACSEHVGRNA